MLQLKWQVFEKRFRIHSGSESAAISSRKSSNGSRYLSFEFEGWKRNVQSVQKSNAGFCSRRRDSRSRSFSPVVVSWPIRARLNRYRSPTMYPSSCCDGPDRHQHQRRCQCCCRRQHLHHLIIRYVNDLLLSGNQRIGLNNVGRCDRSNLNSFVSLSSECASNANGNMNPVPRTEMVSNHHLIKQV